MKGVQAKSFASDGPVLETYIKVLQGGTQV
jgi:hypothetical protein